MKKIVKYVNIPITIYLVFAYIEGTFYFDKTNRIDYVLSCFFISFAKWMWETIEKNQINEK